MVLSLVLNIIPYPATWVGLALLYVVHVFAYAFFLSPVRHIPGPWYARVSRVPYLYATYQRRRGLWVAKLMKDYQSSAIVIAPNQINTTSETAMKAIYDRSAVKTKAHSGMGWWKGVRTTSGHPEYTSVAAKRNSIIRCFQDQNLLTLAENIQDHVLQLKDIIYAKSSRDEEVDGLVWLRFLALDVVTDILWGEQRRFLSEMDGNATTKPDFVRRYEAFSVYNALKGLVPGADLYVRFFGTAKWKRLRADNADMDLSAREALARWEEGNKETRNRDVLSMLLAMSKAEDPEKRIPPSHLPAYMIELLGAGSNTSASTASFAFFELARHPDIQTRLRQELFDTFPQAEGLDPTKTLKLPFLDAVIRETMRIHPMVPGPLERHLGKPVEIMGHVIPAGTVASTAALTQGLLGDVFPDPMAFKPQRWLAENTTDEVRARMDLNWIPFGTGSRACPGASLAMYEMKYILGTMLRTFRSVIPPNREHEQLDLTDIFGAVPRSGHIWLKFQIAEQEV